MKTIIRNIFSGLVLILACWNVFQEVQASESTVSVQDCVSFLTDGVEFLTQRGVPGPVAVLGDDAFPVITSEDQNGTVQAVLAASFFKKGRVVAFGHTDYCNSSFMSSDVSSTKLFNNIVFWVAGKTRKDSATASSIRVAVWRDQTTANYLKEQGFNAFVPGSIDDKFDVLIAGAVKLSNDEYEVLLKAVQNGAGYITCGLGWGWSQLNPGKSLVKDHSGNYNFSRFGVPLAWTQGTLAPTSKDGYKVSNDKNKVASPYVNASKVLKFLEGLNVEKADKQFEELSENDRAQIFSTTNLCYPYFTKEQREFCNNFFSKVTSDIIPSVKTPIQKTDYLARLTASVQTKRFLHSQVEGEISPDEVPPFAAGKDFPGPVPNDAPRLDSVKIPVKTAIQDWASTGLYAAPGETISVRVSSELLAKFPKAFKIRIGAHSDTLWHLQKWVRYPEITLERTIVSAETRIANPFGGMIYIVVPSGIGAAGLGKIDFEISGAVAAPYFVKDITSLDDWKKIRNNPAPWAELQGNDVIVTVPSNVIRNLDDPQALLDTWDNILRLEAELASGPYYRPRPERILCDREISAGYMHSGYPVMTHMDVDRVLVDNERLRSKGDWGFFHEFGHNHQSSLWTFEGSGEVTVNYFTLYIMEKLCGLAPEQTRNELSKESRLSLLSQYFANGTNFEDWKANPFLALNMTVQLRNEFGWEPFIRAISEYRNASVEELPHNDLEKRDQWLIRLSRNTGKNLGPFFEKWGVPTSQEARDAVKDLPVWISQEFEEVK